MSVTRKKMVSAAAVKNDLTGAQWRGGMVKEYVIDPNDLVTH